MRKPYVGVTGFTERSQVEAVLTVFPKLNGQTMGDWEDLPLWMMAGVLVSSKTMRGGQNRWPERYPEIEKVAGIIPCDPRILGLVHFNTDSEDLFGELKFLFEAIGYPKSIDGIQLNIAWPDVAQVRLFWHHYLNVTGRELYVVLQVGEDAFRMTGEDPGILAAWIHDYNGFADYVLLDPSGGEGKAFDPYYLLPFVDALTASNGNAGIGIAGGLSGSHYAHLLPIVDKYPCVSVDAEGGIRAKPTDELDVGRAVSYAKAMIALHESSVRLHSTD